LDRSTLIPIIINIGGALVFGFVANILDDPDDSQAARDNQIEYDSVATDILSCSTALSFISWLYL
jgi:hypothetical protein